MEIGDLTDGMDPAVGAAGTNQVKSMLKNNLKGFFNFALYGPLAVRLDLPAGKIGAVVGDG